MSSMKRSKGGSAARGAVLSDKFLMTFCPRYFLRICSFSSVYSGRCPRFCTCLLNVDALARIVSLKRLVQIAMNPLSQAIP
jgi:hypothetical protein